MMKSVTLLCLKIPESFGSQIPVAAILNLGNSVSAKADSFLEWMMPCALYES